MTRQARTFTDDCQHQAPTVQLYVQLDSVVNDREAVVITRTAHDPVVIVSLEDYESLRETAYLMSRGTEWLVPMPPGLVSEIVVPA